MDLQYFHEHATVTAAVIPNPQSPSIEASATVGNPTFAFGVEAGYDTTTNDFTKYTAGITVTNPDWSSAIIL